MGAMMMPFRVTEARELKGLHPGSRITFELIVKDMESFVQNVHTLGDTDLDLPIPPNKVAVGEVVPDFTLTDQSRRAIRLSDLRGKVVAINFIYTRCPLPDVCPRLSANFAAIARRYQSVLGRELVLLSITIDPRHDTPEVLADYAKRWSADPATWHFLTGTPESINTAAGVFGLVYWPEEGSLTHTSETAILSRDGHLAAIVEGSSYRIEQLSNLVAHELGGTHK
jgi:protein SCO1/2